VHSQDASAADLRRFVTERAGSDSGSGSDVGKVAHAIIASTAGPAPLRLALGSDAYDAIHAALTDRLTALAAQHTVAVSTDDRGSRDNRS
jgi:hypothetical protein